MSEKVFASMSAEKEKVKGEEMAFYLNPNDETVIYYVRNRWQIFSKNGGEAKKKKKVEKVNAGLKDEKCSFSVWYSKERYNIFSFDWMKKRISSRGSSISKEAATFV